MTRPFSLPYRREGTYRGGLTPPPAPLPLDPILAADSIVLSCFIFFPAWDGQLILLVDPRPVLEGTSLTFAPMLLLTKTPRVLLGVLSVSLLGSFWESEASVVLFWLLKPAPPVDLSLCYLSPGFRELASDAAGCLLSNV